MAKFQKYALRLIIVAGIIVLGATFARHLMKSEPIAVVLVPVERGEVQAVVSNTRAGTVKACRRARLSPATGGQVARLSVSEGDKVQRGQVLMIIWNEDLEARVQLAASEELAASFVANSWHTLRADKMLVQGGQNRTFADGLDFERENSPGPGPDMMERLKGFGR